MDTKYGNCSRCDTKLEPIWYKEEEHKVKDGVLFYTGRERISCSHLECPQCFKRETVDDTFDKDWYTPLAKD